jgi:uncharacterized protein YkuJ
VKITQGYAGALRTGKDGNNMVAIKFSTANEAFDVPGPEIARILRRIADDVELRILPNVKIFDANGNTVGSFKYTEA